MEVAEDEDGPTAVFSKREAWCGFEVCAHAGDQKGKGLGSRLANERLEQRRVAVDSKRARAESRRRERVSAADRTPGPRPDRAEPPRPPTPHGVRTTTTARPRSTHLRRRSKRFHPPGEVGD